VKRFRSILLIVDQGTDYSVALKRAVALANNNQALLTVCAVVDAVPRDLQMAITAVTPLELQKIAISEKQVWLDEVVKSGAVAGVPLESIILVGKPFIEIIRQVLGNGHDLIIKCAEDSGGSGRMLFGSTDMHLMRKCPCPVWITKPTEHHQYRRILAAVDLDPKEAVKDVLNRQILEMSTSLAIADCSEVHIVHAWKLYGEDILESPRSGILNAELDLMLEKEAVERAFWLENLVNNYGAKADKDAIDYVSPQLHLIKGTAKAAIPKKARELDVDLIVMGTVARSGIPGFFMGNTAESILNQIDCSVLAIKPPGFESPVTH